MQGLLVVPLDAGTIREIECERALAESVGRKDHADSASGAGRSFSGPVATRCGISRTLTVQTNAFDQI